MRQCGGPCSQILLVDDSCVVDEECLDTGNAIFGRPAYQCEATNHLAFHDVVVSAARCLRPLGGQNPEIIAVIRYTLSWRL